MTAHHGDPKAFLALPKVPFTYCGHCTIKVRQQTHSTKETQAPQTLLHNHIYASTHYPLVQGIYQETSLGLNHVLFNISVKITITDSYGLHNAALNVKAI